jgi:hypothetical protein
MRRLEARRSVSDTKKRTASTWEQRIAETFWQRVSMISSKFNQIFIQGGKRNRTANAQ